MGLEPVAHGDTGDTSDTGTGEIKRRKPHLTLSPPLSPKPGEERRWIHLWYEFTQETTWHGVRFITQRKSYTIRRLLWLIVVLAGLAGFVYALISQLLFLLSKPKAVNVEVVYNDTLTFPTVTICNQNFFRGSKTFQMGLYDRVNSRFSQDQLGASFNTTCVEGEFIEFQGIFLTDSKYFTPIQISTSYFATYEQITLQVCRHICLVYHSAICNGFAYQVGNRRCSLTSLTTTARAGPSEPGFITDPSEIHVHNDPSTDFYQRITCFGLKKSTCDFENGLCMFYKEGDVSSRWQRHSGPTSTPGTGPETDHTRVIGHYMYVEPLISKYRKKSDIASLVSPYISSDRPICVSLAYSLIGNADDLGTIKILRRHALGYNREHLVWSVQGQTADWELDLIDMGTGLFQVVITVEPGKGALGDVAIDDVSIGPCEDFVEECRRTIKGNIYIGSQTRTMSGRSCVPWNETEHLWYLQDPQNPMNLNEPKKSKFTFPITPGSESTCRNPNNDVNGPWCYVADGSSFVIEYCDVPFCACTENQFKCANEMCIHKLLTCDGKDHCGDGTDETLGCDISPTCTFETKNSCGYNLDPYGLVPRGKSSWIRYRGQIRNGNLRRDHTLNSKLGHFLYLDSGSATLSFRERVAVGAPRLPTTNSTRCIEFYYYNLRDVIHPEAMGTLRVYQTFGRYYRKLLAEFEGTAYADDWRIGRVTIPASESDMDFNITFEAAVGNSYYSDMAIDDVQLNDNSCYWTGGCLEQFKCLGKCIEMSRLCDGTADCLDFSDEDPSNCQVNQLQCLFSTAYSCGYQDDSNPDKNGWQKHPGNDFVEVYDEEPGLDSMKRFISPRYKLTEDNCLAIRYTANTFNFYCILSIYQELIDNRTLIYKVGGSSIGQADTVHGALVTVPYVDHMNLAFEANCTTVADKINMRLFTVILYPRTTCEQFVDSRNIGCEFENRNMCGYLDVSREGINWVPDANKGIYTELPRIANKDTAEALLLFPTLELLNVSCVSIAMEIDSAPSYVFISEYWDTKTVYGILDLHVPPPYRLTFNAGVYRPVLRVSIPRGGHLTITSVSYTAGTCPDSGRDRIIFPPEREADRGGFLPPRIHEEGSVVLLPDPENYMPGDPVAKEENLIKYYRQAGHQASSLISRCHWAGQPCTPDNFTSEITDFGYCHTFNPGTSGYPLLKTASTGASAGLRLILNVEQYDYMNGPHSDAGVKIFLSAMGEVPQVRDLGFAAGPGSHAFVAVKLTQTKSLRQPWGSCGTQTLEYGGVYTYSACIRECETKAMVKACGCRDAYMPFKTENDPPVCNITQYLSCAVGKTFAFSDMSITCNCTEPCQRDIYESQVSYAELSRLSVNQILTTDLYELNNTHHKILEINQRADAGIISLDLKLFNDIHVSYSELLEFTFREAWDPDRSFIIKVEKALQYFVQSILGVDVSQTVVGKVADYKRTFDGLYGPTLATLQTLNATVLSELEVLVRLYDAYITGSENQDQIASHIGLVQKNVVFLKSTIDTLYQAIKSSRIVYNAGGLNIGIIYGHLPTTINVLHQDCDTTMRTLVDDNSVSTAMERIRPTIVNHVETFVDSNNLTVSHNIRGFGDAMVLNDLISAQYTLRLNLKGAHACLSEYRDFLQQLDDWYTDFKETQAKLLAAMTQTSHSVTVNDIMDYVSETELLTDFRDEISDLSRRFNLGEVTKEAIGNIFASDKAALQDVSIFASRISSRLIEPKRSMIRNVKKLVANTYKELVQMEMKFSKYFDRTHSELPLRSLQLWSRPRANEDDIRNPHTARDIFQLGNLQRFIDIHSTKVLNELADWYTGPLEEAINRFESRMNVYHNGVNNALGNMKTQIESFRRQTKLGPNFIKENFIAVDVFFTQLKYESTEQIKAYDIEAFFGDVGGFMGLLLGASVLSIIEILDLVMYNCVRKIGQYRKNTTKDGKESKNMLP